MEAKQILEKYRKLVWPVVKKYLRTPTFPGAYVIPKKYQADLDYFWKIVRDYPERQGKYLRPALVLLTAQAMGVKPKKALKIAAGMQLSEDWLLIHDDFEDNSLARRGQPALHRIYGNELAVNAGDALQVIMWKIFFDSYQDLGWTKTKLILDEFYTQLSRTTVGQMTEINWTQKNKTDFNDQDWFFIADGKTAYYTIACPMRLGTIVAGANHKQLEKLAEFGIYLGRCFQLVDDLLDLTSDFAGLKKQQGNDLYEGKKTVMLGHLLRTAKATDKKKLLAILAKSRDQKSASEVAWILSKMRAYGSLEYGRKLAETYKNKAETFFEKELGFLSAEPARSELKSLINFILERNY